MQERESIPGKACPVLSLYGALGAYPDTGGIVMAQHIHNPCGILLYVKAIQITFDEGLLDRLDRHPRVREHGRSAVLREAAAAYLTRKDAEDIAERYRAGYSGAAPDDELQGWAGEGVWPDR